MFKGNDGRAGQMIMQVGIMRRNRGIGDWKRGKIKMNWAGMT
jgi:hypothetical protein